ncbi:MAG: efflux RND transporter permease subunit [bacterium]|nr:efflux RND transporter permease subunit [bacterium]
MKRAIEWFAQNSVAANLLMILILGGGLFMIPSIRMEVFPEFSADLINVSVIYRGAAPQEVEESVNVRIEEAVQGLEGIKRVTSVASENRGTVSIEALNGTDIRKLLDDVKARVDAIDTFPGETEKPVITEVVPRRQVINIAISGPADERTLKTIGEQVRDDISAIPGITQVDMTNARPYEIAIEVRENDLRRYELTFDEVARAVRSFSLDLPGGSIRTEGGEILLRRKGQAYRGSEFESIILRTRPDGTRLTLGEVAHIVDGFAETDQTASFDAEPTVLIQVYRVGDQNALDITDKVKAYINDMNPRMPEGIKLTVWADFSRILTGRLDLMLRNGRMGFVLVFVLLTLFLRLRLAIWVALGIPISFLGAVSMMPGLDASINLISLFAFIVVLGIVVDDAIIVGENIYRHYQMGKRGLTAAIDGVREVYIPVIFAVLTSVAAFSPLLLVSGSIGKIMKLIPEIVILALVFSLVESLFILPAHLAHSNMDNESTGKGLSWWRQHISLPWQNFQDFFAVGLLKFVDRTYRPAIEMTLKWRYATLASGVAILVVTLGLVAGGWIKFTFFPKVDADNVVAMLTMPQGTSPEVTREAVRRLERSALQLRDQIERDRPGSVFRHVLASVGEQPFRAAQSQNGGSAGGSFSAAHLGEVNIELQPSENREISSTDLATQWRELNGPIPDAIELTFSSSLFSSGEAINIQFSGPDYEELKVVSAKLKQKLEAYPGVIEITDSFRSGKQEVKLSLSREAEVMGMTLADLARQVRQAFYGEEAQRIQRGRDDIRVMVRYPESERRSLGNLEAMRIRTPNGGEVPFSVAAEAELGRGYASIKRADRKKVINVTADVNNKIANANEILADVTRTVLPQILADHPLIRFDLEGEQREQRETLAGLSQGFLIALLVIYILLAVPFKSYVQPMIVMTAIPFGIVGAAWGHAFLDMDLTIMSLFGVVALTGVVVNDSLVMVDFINQHRASGMPFKDAIREAGAARFRPIILTSLTTFAGLAPILLEKSLQAQFLIPMATSLGFGVMFATFITLILVPVLYHIIEDIIDFTYRLLGRERVASLEALQNVAD